MASGLMKNDFWELSPYCFCQNRDWLTVESISTVNIPVNGESTRETASIAGLGRDDTALLASLLTALALFLFLLFLLLCCLFPWGLCFLKDSKCCGGGGAGKSKKRKEGLISSSDSSTGSVNLTALDMKIPRPWMDTQDGGFSDSELEKFRKFQGWHDIADTNVDKTDQRFYSNEGYQKDSVFQDGGWFTTSDLESIYGGDGTGSRRRLRKGSLEEGDSHQGSWHQKQYGSQYRKSRSLDNLDSLMTYSPNQMNRSDSYVRQTAYAGNAKSDDVSSIRYHGNSDAGSVIEEVRLTRTKTLNLPTTMQNKGNGSISANKVMDISLTSSRENIGEFPSLTSPMPYMENTNQSIAINNTTPNPNSLERSSDHDVISEYKAYKRVVKETTTTTTTE